MVVVYAVIQREVTETIVCTIAVYLRSNLVTWKYATSVFCCVEPPCEDGHERQALD